jgi:hypothetical protein
MQNQKHSNTNHAQHKMKRKKKKKGRSFEIGFEKGPLGLCLSMLKVIAEITKDFLQ